MALTGTYVLHVSSWETHVAYALEQIVAGMEDGSGARWQMCGYEAHGSDFQIV
jgi:hypothetical protein